jgi:uncharacterized membrane protein YphA (DoxX/SURF4 family)
MKALLTISRIIIGVLFIFSGMVKANDPAGLSYKMQEFFEVWGWDGLHNYTLALAIVMIAFEIIAGVAVLLGWQMRLFSWLLMALIVFFTFLTGYALLSGKIKTCGCFGDCLPITPLQSFLKDLLLTALIFFVLLNYKKIKPVFNTAISSIILIIVTLLSFDTQWYVLKHLPFKDCLPYKKGTGIIGQTQAPPGSVPDSTVISFVYKKAGKEVEFTADKFPEDFDETMYTYVKRYDKVVRKGNAEPPIKDFVLLLPNGNDTTQQILQQNGDKIFVFTQGINENRAAWLKHLKEVVAISNQKNIPVYFITNNEKNIESWLQQANLFNKVVLLRCDLVAIKTAARANPTIYHLQKDVIKNKWGYADFNETVTAVTGLSVAKKTGDAATE